eukprot:s2188_g2.t1
MGCRGRRGYDDDGGDNDDDGGDDRRHEEGPEEEDYTDVPVLEPPPPSPTRHLCRRTTPKGTPKGNPKGGYDKGYRLKTTYVTEDPDGEDEPPDEGEDEPDDEGEDPDGEDELDEEVEALAAELETLTVTEQAELPDSGAPVRNSLRERRRQEHRPAQGGHTKPPAPPKGKGTPKGTTGKSANLATRQVHVTEETEAPDEEHAAFFVYAVLYRCPEMMLASASTSHGYMIVNTACQRTCHGQGWMEQHLELLNAKGNTWLPEYPSSSAQEGL